MYTSFYKLTGRPFQLTPDPRFYFNSRSHKKAMAYLTYGLSQGEGFIIITGDIGAGKTTLVGHLFDELDRNKVVAAKVVTTQLDADDILRMVAGAFGIQQEGHDKATILKQIESFLHDRYRRGKRVLLIVDEAQNLPKGALEELRMLSNFTLDEKPLMQCFLLGQPQFRERLATDPDLEQLNQRAIATYHLEPMDEEEVSAYITHRLQLVGWQNDPSFAPETFARIHEYTGGVPRKVNTFCSRLLLYGFLEELHEITLDVVDAVIADAEGEYPTTGRAPLRAKRAHAPASRSPALNDPPADPPAATVNGAGNGLDVDALMRRIDVLEKYVRAHDRTLRKTIDILATWLEEAEQQDAGQ